MIAEKIWAGDAKMQYPNQWVVMVQMETDPITHKDMGIVYLVTSDMDEAYRIIMTLGDNLGESVVIEGFVDTPCYIGGLHI